MVWEVTVRTLGSKGSELEDENERRQEVNQQTDVVEQVAED